MPLSWKTIKIGLKFSKYFTPPDTISYCFFFLLLWCLQRESRNREFFVLYNININTKWTLKYLNLSLSVAKCGAQIWCIFTYFLIDISNSRELIQRLMYMYSIWYLTKSMGRKIKLQCVRLKMHCLTLRYWQWKITRR